MRRGGRLSPLKHREGRACLNVDPLEPSQINLLKVHSRDIWQIPASRDGKDRGDVAW